MAEVGKVQDRRGTKHTVARDSDGEVRVDGKRTGIFVKSDSAALAAAKEIVDNM